MAQAEKLVNKVKRLLRRLKLPRQLHHFGPKMYALWQHLLAMGRGLMQYPQLLLLDEPSLGLAPIIMKDLFKRIQSINNEGTTILMVEQNAKAACAIADTIYVLEEGKIALKGGKKLLNDSRIQKIYLGGHGH